MDHALDSRRVVLFESFSALMGGAVFLTGILVLAGWQMNIAALKSVFPGIVSMKPNTALCFVLCGASLFLKQVRRENRILFFVAQGFAGLTALVGGLTLAEYALKVNLGIDEILFREDPGAVFTLYPGRMAPNTALCYVISGIALFVLDHVTKKDFCPSQFLGFPLAVISFLPFVGYVYGIATFNFGVGAYTAMALHTAIAFMMLSLGIFFARSDRGIALLFTFDDVGGMIIRRLLPIAIPLPICLGGLKLFMERNHWISNEFGVAFVAVGNITIISAYILWLGKSISRLVGKQRDAEDSRASSEKRYKALFDDTGDAILICDLEGKFLEVNRAACERLGYSPETFREMSAKDIHEPFDANAVRKLLERIRSEGRFVYDAVYKKNDGTPVPVEVSSQMTDYGGRLAVLSVARDVAERKRMEMELQAKMKDLESFNKIAIGREMRMIELKEKIRELEAKLAKR